MRDRDMLKDDAIAHLSDQLMAISIDCRKLKEDSSWYDCNTFLTIIQHDTPFFYVLCRSDLSGTKFQTFT